MECNNQYCLWNTFNQCCPESEELHDKATPNKLDCPSSLRVDFEEQMSLLFYQCSSLLRCRNMSELVEIRKFIQSQRKEVD